MEVYFNFVDLATLVGGGILVWVEKQEVSSIELSEIKKPEKFVKEEAKPEDKTANWETYKNEEYGFVIRYPKNWLPGEETYPEAYLLRKNFSKIDKSDGQIGGYGDTKHWPDYTISIIIVQKSKDDPQFKEITTGSPDFEITIFSPESKIRATGYKKLLGLPSTVGEIVKVARGDYIYYLTFEGSGTRKTDKNNAEIFHKIVSTFRFLE